MSSDTEEFICRHFSSLHDEKLAFTSGHFETQSHLPSQFADEEAREIEEALRISAQEVVER